MIDQSVVPGFGDVLVQLVEAPEANPEVTSGRPVTGAQHIDLIIDDLACLKDRLLGDLELLAGAGARGHRVAQALLRREHLADRLADGSAYAGDGTQ
ncbi:hypothetical protein CKY47_02450 [Saccharothrix yanglingensis]|uniref:Uncharacterized protein n=1 Tax=Saccharothrix yanglingensis TaxID=659496 RepID=A0ABU0WSP6_9PSEU|nr:hypothetical protein [Saccharothrix yanglingensis]